MEKYIMKLNIIKHIFVAFVFVFLFISSPILTLPAQAVASNTCVDPVTGKIKDWVNCLTPLDKCINEWDTNCIRDNLDLTNATKESFFFSWYDTYYQKQMVGVSPTDLPAKNKAFNKTLTRILGDVGFILGSLYALTLVYQIIRATMDYVTAGEDEAKFKGAKKRVFSAMWAFFYVVIVFAVAGIIYNLMGYGNLFEVEILKSDPIQGPVDNSNPWQLAFP